MSGAPRGSGFSLVEVLVAMLIIGGLAVAAMNTLGAVGMSRRSSIEQARAGALARDLLSEIVEQPYAASDVVIGFIGIESPELLDGTRYGFNDVDDYDGWSASPPETRDGTPIDGFESWTRSATVEWVAADSSLSPSGSDEGLKLITVRVSSGERVLAEARAVRTLAFDKLTGRTVEENVSDEIIPINLPIPGF